jgi:hypothetical protein
MGFDNGLTDGQPHLDSAGLGGVDAKTALSGVLPGTLNPGMNCYSACNWTLMRGKPRAYLLLGVQLRSPSTQRGEACPVAATRIERKHLPRERDRNSNHGRAHRR